MNFKEYPVDLEGPIVVPEEEVPVKPVKQEKKFFDFFKKKKKVNRHLFINFLAFKEPFIIWKKNVVGFFVNI